MKKGTPPTPRIRREREGKQFSGKKTLKGHIDILYDREGKTGNPTRYGKKEEHTGTGWGSYFWEEIRAEKRWQNLLHHRKNKPACTTEKGGEKGIISKKGGTNAQQWDEKSSLKGCRPL